MSSRTSTILQFIFHFWSFEISEHILRNKNLIIGLDSYSRRFIYLDPILIYISLRGWDPVKPVYAPQYFYTDRSKAVLLLWFLTVTFSCCPYLYFGLAIMLVTYFVNFRQLNDHLFGKELFMQFTASAFRKLPSNYVFSYFPFGFEGRMWDLIVSVTDHCLSFYFESTAYLKFTKLQHVFLWLSLQSHYRVTVAAFLAETSKYGPSTFLRMCSLLLKECTFIFLFEKTICFRLNAWMFVARTCI